MQLKQSLIKPIVFIGSALLVIILFISIFSGTYNSVVNLEENINTSNSNISKEEKRRVDLFNNLVDAVQSARTFEQETQTKIAEARSQGNAGNVSQAMLTIDAVAEAYPEIKSVDLYRQTMLEFSVTENRIANYREQYNNDIRGYNRKVRSFPTNIILGTMGYEKQNFKYLEYETKENEHRNLF